MDETVTSHTETNLSHLVAIENKSDMALKSMQVLKDKAELQDATHELAIMATEAVNFAKSKKASVDEEEKADAAGCADASTLPPTKLDHDATSAPLPPQQQTQPHEPPPPQAQQPLPQVQPQPQVQ